MSLEINFTGALLQKNGACLFRVWAPEKELMYLHLVSPSDMKVEMIKNDEGYFEVIVQNVAAGALYFFNPDKEKDIPDPTSFFQPKGVHGPSEVIDHDSYQWNDGNWRSIPFEDLIIYELHVGTFTQEGTFAAAAERIDELLETGINAIEVMPISQFPGNRNWGYDGVFPYAVQNSYGTPDQFKRFIDTCHQKGMAVILDVVYNHLGPEGNYFSLYGPYFTHQYKTPWGDAINYDGEWADGVRDYFSNNALYWLKYYHLDGLRLDAIHAVFDNGAVHFWEYLNKKVRAYERVAGRVFYTIAESDLNNPRVLKSEEEYGFGFTSQWLDDFHHALYTIIDKKGRERYYDFGMVEQLAKAYKEGFVHAGEWAQFRKRKYGKSSSGISGNRFVAFVVNHDQAGNRVLGERPSMLIDFEHLKLLAAGLLLAPYVPMLFMGEEYGDESPFLYFISHSDPDLVEAVRKGRKEEFKNVVNEGEAPDAQSEDTFNKSKLQWHKRTVGKHAKLLAWYKTLIELRRTKPPLKNFNKNDLNTFVIGQSGLIIHRQSEDGKQHLLCIFNFSDHQFLFRVPSYAQRWKIGLDSRDQRWQEHNDNKNIRSMPAHMSADDSVMVEPFGVSIYESM
jgi:maltooligosyltrehalose trehalohydrolase